MVKALVTTCRVARLTLQTQTLWCRDRAKRQRLPARFSQKKKGKTIKNKQKKQRTNQNNQKNHQNKSKIKVNKIKNDKEKHATNVSNVQCAFVSEP